MNSLNPNGPDRNTTGHISEDDLVLFALQFMPEAQAAVVFEHLQTCEACRMALGDIQGELALVALTSEPQQLPAHAREQFLRRVAKEKKLIAIDRRPEARPEPVLSARSGQIFASHEAESEPRGRGAVAMAWVGWALAACLGVFAFLQLQQRQILQGTLDTESASVAQAQNQATNSQAQAEAAQEALQTLTSAGAMQVSLHLPAVKAPLPEAHAAYIASKGALVLVASHLHPLAAGKTYELWLLPSAAHGTPIPAGTFRPDAQGFASVVLPALPKGVQAKGFGVTIEPDGGSTAPTPPIILAGE